MLVLGIETSQKSGGVALCEWAAEDSEAESSGPGPGPEPGGRCLEELRLDRPGHRHAQALPVVVEELLGERGLAVGDLDLLAVSIGPGSFTGLRVGVVFAKTLAWATGCRLVAVDTLSALAEGVECDEGTDDMAPRLFVVTDAQRQELFVGEFLRDEQGEWAREGEITIRPAEAWSAARSRQDIVAAVSLPALHDLLERTCRLISLGPDRPRAADVVAVGVRRFQAGLAADPWTLEPLYLRKSAAEEQRDGVP